MVPDPPRSAFSREEACEAAIPAQLPVIPLVKPFLTGNELAYIRQAIEKGNTAGDGYFSERCCSILRQRFGIREVLLVSSGTSALDLAAALCELEPGDEVILPSYTFPATANAFLRLGARLRFAEIRPDTLNLNEAGIESLITSRTRAIVPVHYAGVGCEMDVLMELAHRHGLIVVEDAAQGVDAYYRDRALGTFGSLAIYSFHEAKNHTAGQAGALCVNDSRFVERAEILRDKGTNRRQFFRGQVPRYEWVDCGVSHALSEINAAFLCAQLEAMDQIAQRRARIDAFYRQALAPLAHDELLTLGTIPDHCRSNYHILFFLLRDEATRDALVRFMRLRGIAAPFHYTPLHTSPMGRKLGYRPGDLPVTENCAARLVRLPFYHDLTIADQQKVCEAVYEFFGRTLA
jgi:dTDP-4-amino-4,6-dideoxygalactose transaminase